MKYRIYIALMFVFLIVYTGCTVFNKSEKLEETTTSAYTPEKVLEAEIPETPELSAEEKAAVQEDIKLERQEIEQELDIEKKSVEQMRDDVHEILDEIIETDSTVQVSFNMTYTMQD
jgi:hypothetical protein